MRWGEIDGGRRKTKIGVAISSIEAGGELRM